MTRQASRTKFSVVADKPDLQVHAADYTETARTLARTMARELENLFVFSGEPVLVVRNSGKPKVRPLTCNRVIIEAHKIVTPFKYIDKHCR
jgi:hypothetical protein